MLLVDANIDYNKLIDHLCLFLWKRYSTAMIDL